MDGPVVGRSLTIQLLSAQEMATFKKNIGEYVSISRAVERLMQQGKAEAAAVAEVLRDCAIAHNYLRSLALACARFCN